MRYWPSLLALASAVLVVSIAGGASRSVALLGAGLIVAHVLVFLAFVSLDPVNRRTGFRRSELGHDEMDRLDEELRNLPVTTPRPSDREVS